MPRKSGRTGYTTGTCATAAAKAASLALLHQEAVATVSVTLPAGQVAHLAISSCAFDSSVARCSVIKDAGDDPDITHGAEIVATVSWAEEPGLHLRGGKGVGVVTKPGLGLPLGEAAINPVPRQMICTALTEVAGTTLEQRGLEVVISVPEGERLAPKTLNSRLGILGGISILGTTGIVTPYSTEAYKACIDQGLNVALAAGLSKVVLTTGSRSEQFAQRLFPWPEEAFIQVGDFIGHAMEQCAARPLQQVVICGMVGKLSKMAAGHVQTHVSRSTMEVAVLADLAADLGVNAETVARLRAANTARHALEIALQDGADELCPAICRVAARHCHTLARGAVAVHCVMTDFEGNVLGTAESNE